MSNTPNECAAGGATHPTCVYGDCGPRGERQCRYCGEPPPLTPGWTNSKMNPWVPDTDPRQARRIGKTAEEVAELGAVLARISIQGINATDPSSGKTNFQRLWEETADVMAQIECNMRSLFTYEQRMLIEDRKQVKVIQMAEWEAHYE